MKNKYIPNSEDDSDNETPRSLLENLNVQSVENQEAVLRTSTNTSRNSYFDEETVHDLSNLEVYNIDSVRQDLETPNTSQKGRVKRGR